MHEVMTCTRNKVSNCPMFAGMMDQLEKQMSEQVQVRTALKNDKARNRIISPKLTKK